MALSSNPFDSAKLIVSRSSSVAGTVWNDLNKSVKQTFGDIWIGVDSPTTVNRKTILSPNATERLCNSIEKSDTVFPNSIVRTLESLPGNNGEILH
jgi:hypothetical protein